MDGLLTKVGLAARKLTQRLKSLWEGSSIKRKLVLGLGGGVSVGAVVVGGIVAQACFSALVVNAFGWILLKDSPKAWAFMQAHGVKVDWAITGLGIFCTVGASVTLGLTLMLMGVFFSVFRTLLLEEEIVSVHVESDVQEAVFIEGVWS